jgi:hypothetical protein
MLADVGATAVDSKGKSRKILLVLAMCIRFWVKWIWVMRLLEQLTPVTRDPSAKHGGKTLISIGKEVVSHLKRDFI